MSFALPFCNFILNLKDASKTWCKNLIIYITFRVKPSSFHILFRWLPTFPAAASNFPGQDKTVISRLRKNFDKICFSMMLSATVSCLLSEIVWRDSSFSCVWKFHRRVQMQGLAAATFRIHPLHPSSQHPNSRGICLSWTFELTPIQPCLHGNWVCECLVCKPFPDK